MGNLQGSEVRDDRSVVSVNSESSSTISLFRQAKRKKVDPLIVSIMMPLYYTTDALSFNDLLNAKLAWDTIINGTARLWIEQKHDLPYETCRQWFESTFYNRLFDVHPISKKMFRDPASQGKFLVALFNFIFTVLDNQKKFNDRLIELAESHCKRGVKASEYAIIGEVMFWTLRKILQEAYDAKCHTAWMKIFSGMLTVIVPISISYELVSNTAQTERLRHFKSGTPTPTNEVGDTTASGCPFMPPPSANEPKRRFTLSIGTLLSPKKIFPKESRSLRTACPSAFTPGHSEREMQ